MGYVEGELMDHIGGARAGMLARHAAAIAAVAVLVLPGEAGAAVCRPTPDQASVAMRALQTELMVAGLKCSAEQWNSFTRQFKTTIKRDADRLQSLFRKTYGAAGATRMNSFVTQLANDASQRSNKSAEADYCRQEDELFKQVLALTGTDLEAFAAGRSVTVPTPVSLCVPDSGVPDSAPSSGTLIARTSAKAR